MLMKVEHVGLVLMDLCPTGVFAVLLLLWSLSIVQSNNSRYLFSFSLC